jgi:glycosyltransferase involved in cell wall biosynthesis
MKKHLVVVLGMHRSGTSALARGIEALGFSFGDSLMPPVHGENEKGYWEDVDVVNLNDRLLYVLGRAWHSLEPIAAYEWQLPGVIALADEAEALVRKRLAAFPQWAVKDPRMSRLLPFWKSVFERTKVVPDYVIAIRNPLSVERSLAARDGFAAEKSYFLWLGHVVSALSDTPLCTRVVVDFDTLLTLPLTELKRIANSISVPLNATVNAAIGAYANDFLVPELRHSTFDSSKVSDDPRAGAAVARAFALLADTASGTVDLNSACFLQQWEAIAHEFSNISPLLRRLDDCERMLTATPAEPESDIPSIASKQANTQPQSLPAAPCLTKPATVSVVIPLFNHGRYIEETIQSALSQSVRPTEIIVIDDGSSDDSAARVKALCALHPEIIFWDQPNQGAHCTINAAIYRASGEFVSILNSDDVYAPQRIECCLAAMQSDSNIAMVVTAVRFIDQAGRTLENSWYKKAQTFHEQSADLALAIVNANLLVSTSNYFVRRSVFKEIGYFSPLRYAHDLDFALRIVAAGKQITLLDQALLAYRIHDGNTITESQPRVDVERAAVLALYLYRLWRQAPGGTQWLACLEQWLQWTGSIGMTDLLFYFVAFLEGPSPATARAGLVSALSGWESDSQFPLDWLATPTKGSLLAQLIEVRGCWLQQRPVINAPAGTILVEQSWLASLNEGKAWLEHQLNDLHRELESRDIQLTEQSAWHQQQSSNYQQAIEQRDIQLADQSAWHKQQSSSYQQAIEQRDEQLTELHTWITKLEQARDWLETQSGDLKKSISQLDSQLVEQSAWYEQQSSSYQQAIEQRDGQLTELHTWISKLELTRDWLEEQTNNLNGALKQRELQLAEQQTWIAELENAKSWFIDQNQHLTNTLANHEAHLRVQSNTLATQQEMLTMLDNQNHELQHRLHTITGSRAWRMIKALRLSPPALSSTPTSIIV